MKGSIFFTLFLGVCCFIQAQTFRMYQTENIHNQLMLNTKTGEVKQIQDDGQKFIVNSAERPNSESEGRFELFKTQNMWTFIMLDTFSGQLWQCQYTVDGSDNRFCIVINPYSLSSTESRKFTIQPLTSMFQYYLINEDDGEMWKFQWSTQGDDYRWIEKF